jgi:hypothetical protein
MEVSLVSNSSNSFMSYIKDIHLYLFMMTIIVIILFTLYICINTKIRVLNEKNQNLNLLLDGYKCNIEAISSENFQLKKKFGTRILDLTKYSNEMINELLDSSDTQKNNLVRLQELTKKLNDDIILLQNEDFTIIEKMNKINLKIDQLYKIVIHYLITHGLTDYPLNYLTEDSIRLIMQKYDIDVNILCNYDFVMNNYEFTWNYLPNAVPKMRNILCGSLK